MRRIDRLKKAARCIAKANGHELGQFTKILVSTTSAVNNKYYGRDFWKISACIYCGMEARICEELSSHENKGINVFNAPMEGKAIVKTRLENIAAQNRGEVPPFGKTARGVVDGDALYKKCTVVKNNCES